MSRSVRRSEEHAIIGPEIQSQSSGVRVPGVVYVPGTSSDTPLGGAHQAAGFPVSAFRNVPVPQRDMHT